MYKRILAVIFASALLLLTSCVADAYNPEINGDFSAIPSDYSLTDAEDDGCFVVDDSTLVSDGGAVYPYLLTLSGRGGNPEKDITYYILSESGAVTYDEVWNSYISSTFYPDDPDAPDWEWLGFTVYLP